MSRWGEASRATLRCEQHAPERHCEEKASIQDAVLGSGVPWGVARSVQSPTGKKDPDIPCLRCQPDTSKSPGTWAKLESKAIIKLLEMPWVNLIYPIECLGSHREWKGQGETRHLQHSALSPMLGTRESLEGM